MGDPDPSSRAAADASSPQNADASDTAGDARPSVTLLTSRRQYREEHEKRMKELSVKARLDGKRTPRPVYVLVKEDAKKRKRGSKIMPVEEDIERLYANNGHDFNPQLEYLPGAMSCYGKDYESNSRGIYYRHEFSEDHILCDRKVWRPSHSVETDDTEVARGRKGRAGILATMSKRNDSWLRKSEFGWEVDAWAYIFSFMRIDHRIAMDKHEYLTLRPEVDPQTRMLTGESIFVRCKPDATFGLKTWTHEDMLLPGWNLELYGNRLERLLLHPKYGLVSDPSRSDNDLAFPFMVYEAKGGSGDCRVARRQACSAAVFYLDMLDQLARKPGPWESERPYQTPSSHQYQVFVLTSFEAYWHLLVGHRRPRLSEEHAGVSGMSETVYIFQRLWSGHVISPNKAEEVITLVDRIHTWAVDKHRSFVIQHLRAWHEACDKDYLLEWNPGGDEKNHKKRRRLHAGDGDLKVPSWVGQMSSASQETFQKRALLSLAIADDVQHLLNGKLTSTRNRCLFLGCGCRFNSISDRIEHLRKVHGTEERGLERLARCTRQPKKIAAFSESQAENAWRTLSRHQWDQLTVKLKRQDQLRVEVAEKASGSSNDPLVIL